MKKPVAILDQFVEKGKTITYMTAFNGFMEKHDDGRMPNSIAVFKIYMKPQKNTLVEKLIPFIRNRRAETWAFEHLICNQINSR